MTIAKKLTENEASYNPAKAKWVRGRHAGKPLRVTLATARSAAAKTQVQVSEASGMAQGDVSKLERRDSLDEVQVSTLRRYVEALGGDLEIIAVIGGRRIALTGAVTPDRSNDHE